MRQPFVWLARSALRSPIVAAPALAAARWFGQRTATVLMLHRFRDAHLGNEGEDPDDLRRVLARLRSQRVQLMSLRELVRHVTERIPLRGPAVVLTVDDGYLDFGTVAQPILSEFDAPATVFVTTEVVHGRLWFWWDRIEKACMESPRREATLDIGGTAVQVRLGNPDERRAQADQLCELVKWIDLAERTRFVAEIGDALEVALPAQAPEDRRAMGWDDILALEARGVEFGPHSRHHCILSRVDEATARDEIFGSWETMRSKCARAVPIFCYPNGTPESYTMRDERLVREAGLVGAVAYHRERIRPSSFPLSSRFRLPRVEWTNDPLRAAFTASGLFGLG